MLIQTIENKNNGTKWEIWKNGENEYFYKYYEFFQSCGWRFTFQDGGEKQGFYYSKECVEFDFGIEAA